MKQHERTREFQEAAARLRMDSDWQKMVELIQTVMADHDKTLRENPDYISLVRAQSSRSQLQELLDFVDNAQSLDTRRHSGRGFAN